MNLFYHCWEAHDAQVDKHPQLMMKELGIIYTEAIPQSLYDGWEFNGCSNVPDVLPAYLKIIK